MGAGHGVRALVRGQRADRPGALRTRRAARRRRGRPARLLPAGAAPHRRRLAALRFRRARRERRSRDAVRRPAQPGLPHPGLARRRQGADRVLARPAWRRVAGARLPRPRVGHPLPRRPLPGPVRRREGPLRAAADPGVRGGVHPRPHAHPGDRGVRARRAAGNRPDLRLRALPARDVRPPRRRMVRAGPVAGALRTGPPRWTRCTA